MGHALRDNLQDLRIEQGKNHPDCGGRRRKPRLFANEDVPDLEESETLARLFLNRLKDQREILDFEFSDKGLIIILEE